MYFICTRVVIIILLVLMSAVPTQAENFTAKVIDVLDGDSIIVSIAGGPPIKIRLTQIDCPELQQPFGEEAKQFTTNLCLGRNVLVNSIRSDQNGYMLASVQLVRGFIKINDELIKAGLAWCAGEPSDPALGELQSKAKSFNVGLWSDPAAIAPWEFRNKLSREAQLPMPNAPREIIANEQTKSKTINIDPRQPLDQPSLPVQHLEDSPAMRKSYEDYVNRTIAAEANKRVPELKGIGTLSVTIELSVTPSGRAHNTVVAKKSGVSQFDSAFIEAAQASFFQKVLPPPEWHGQLSFHMRYPWRLSYGGDEQRIAAIEKLLNGPFHAVTKEDVLVFHPPKKPAQIIPETLVSRGGRRITIAEARIETHGVNPNSAKAYNIRGSCAAARNDFKLALQHYTKAIQLDPMSNEAYRGRASVELRLGDKISCAHDERIGNALVDAKCKDLCANSADGWFRRGKGKLLLGQFAAAKDDLAHAVLFGSRDNVSIKDRGNIELANGHYQQAIELYNQALLEETTWNSWHRADLYYLRGQAKRFRGDQRAAQEDFAQSDLEICKRLK